MAYGKAVMISPDNAHVHSYTGARNAPAINTGMTGHKGAKIKPGDMLDVDPGVAAMVATERWVLGRYMGAEGFIREAKVFPANMSVKMSLTDWNGGWSRDLAAEVASRNMLYLAAKQTLYMKYPSPLYLRSVFGAAGRHFLKKIEDGDGWMDPDLAAGMKQAKKDWRMEAIRQLRTFRAKASPYAAYDALPDLSALSGQAVGDQLRTLLMGDGKKGFFLGESHNDEKPKKFLITHMAAIKGLGLRKLYIEHFQNDQFQGLFDAYAGAAGTDLQGHFKSLVTSWDGANLARKPVTENLEGVIRKAKDQGIRIVLIDHMESTIDKQAEKWDPKERVLRMNFKSKAIIEADQLANGACKWVALAGAAHIHTHEGGIPGLAQLMAIPAVKLDDAGAKLQPLIENVAYRGENHVFI